MNSIPAASSYRWLFWLLAAIGLAGDQVSKYAIFSHLYHDGDGDRIVVWTDHFDIAVARFGSQYEDNGGILYRLRTIGGCLREPHVNKGALFGIGQGQNLVFGAVSVAAAIFIVVWSLRDAARRDRFLSVALGLILAGTLGNLYDRIVFEGVRDFFHWYKWYDWPVFNVADICLVSGAGMLLLEAFFRQSSEVAPVSAANS